MPTKLLAAFLLLSVFQACSRKIDDDEYEDLTVNQKWVLAPKLQDRDTTKILNHLLKEYDKKLRPDIGIKPTVIDVDIYVNSIGPVSSINMGAMTFTLKDQLQVYREIVYSLEALQAALACDNLEDGQLEVPEFTVFQNN